MIIRCQKEDEKIIESYIGTEYYKCLYLYMNLQRYGTGSQAIDVYMDKFENKIKAVYLFYFSCVHVYSIFRERRESLVLKYGVNNVNFVWELLERPLSEQSL